MIKFYLRLPRMPSTSTSHRFVWPCGWVFALGVQNHERLHGVGTAMLNALCQRFKQRGINKVRTMVDRRNREVLAFFRSQGMMAGPYLELEKDLF